MLIKTINIDKSKRLWLIIICALFVAFLLIAISFFGIYSKTNINHEKEDNIFKINNYYAKYIVSIFGNKTKNTYEVEEWYVDDNGNEKHRFNFKNESMDEISYIISNNELRIENNKEISKFNISEYNLKRENVLSFSTLAYIYNYANDNNSFAKIESKCVDDKIYLILEINKEKIKENSQFDFLMKDGLKFISFELIYNKNTNIPEEYLVLDNNGNVTIGIKYINFDILNKFDQKIFANFNK